MVWCIVPVCESTDVGTPSHCDDSCYPPLLSLFVIGKYEWVKRVAGRGIGAWWRKKERGIGRRGERDEEVLREITMEQKQRSIHAVQCSTTSHTTTTVGRTFIRSGGSVSVTNGVVSLLRQNTPGPLRQPGPFTRRRKSDRRWRTEIRTDGRGFSVEADERNSRWLVRGCWRGEASGN